MTNVALEEDVCKMIDLTVSQCGTVDILVNNAGIMAVNTTSVMRATRKVMSIFLAKGTGVIVNISSIGGLYGKVAGCAYTASKHAVMGITKNIAYMYVTQGIRCNAIAPGA